MKKLTTLFLMLSLAIASFAQLQDPVKWSYAVNDLNETESELVFTGKLDNGWHIYSQYTDDNGPLGIAFEFTPSKDYKLIGKVTESPKPHEEYDSDFGCKVRSFSGKVVFKQKIKRLSDKDFKVAGTFSYQACNNGSCIAPEDRDFNFSVKGATAPADAAEVAAIEETEEAVDTAVAEVAVVEEPKAEEQPTEEEEEEHQSLLWIFLIALGGGILTMFTPCVFPMIPMTVNFFMNGGEDKRKNRRQAFFFGFSIVFLFAVLGAILALLLGPESLYNLGVHWIPNMIFFVIFLIFSMSFFGMFEIKMPEKWINKSDEQADKGGFLAPFFIALTTVLVSFSCTGPILGAALVGLTTSSTDRLVSLLTMLGFGIGFALPFTLLAFFPSFLKNMKSGGWLNTVKVSFAFLELAFGLKFLSMADQYCTWHLLDREIYLALWIVIFALLGFYLLGKLSFHGDEEVKEIGVVRLFLAILDFAFVVYMIPGLWGAPLKGLSGYIPPMDTQDFNIERLVVENAGQGGSTVQFEGKLPADRKHADKLHMPTGFEGFHDLEEAKAYAKKEGKPIFIDFTGRNCNNCREMEQRVWSDPKVLSMLNNEYIVVALYMDDKSKLKEEDWVTDANGRTYKDLGRKNSYIVRERFGVNAQPNYALLDSEGQQMVPIRGYNLDVDGFVKFLQSGIDAFNAGK